MSGNTSPETSKQQTTSVPLEPEERRAAATIGVFLFILTVLLLFFPMKRERVETITDPKVASPSEQVGRKVIVETSDPASIIVVGLVASLILLVYAINGVKILKVTTVVGDFDGQAAKDKQTAEAAKSTSQNYNRLPADEERRLVEEVSDPSSPLPSTKTPEPVGSETTNAPEDASELVDVAEGAKVITRFTIGTLELPVYQPDAIPLKVLADLSEHWPQTPPEIARSTSRRSSSRHARLERGITPGSSK